MQVSLNKNTLAYQIGMRPGVCLRDMSDVSLTRVVKMGLNPFMGLGKAFEVIPGYAGNDTESPMGSATQDGLVFYLLNHAVSMVRSRLHVYEPLGDYRAVLGAYHEQLAVRSARMFFYLLLICTRESRHDKASGTASLYGKTIQAFHSSIKGLGSTAAAERLKQDPPDVKIGEYVNFLSHVFYKGSYNNAYGGAKWGVVADVLRDYVHGKLSAEMMMDTAFTLCHNGGPIFNKGMLFESDFSELATILDVQRSGQIPQYLKQKTTLNSTLKELLELCESVIGKEFTDPGYVDWYKVEELGSLGSYHTHKDAQVAKYGYPSKYKAKLEAEAVKHELEAKLKAYKQANQIEVFPEQYIHKIKERA